MSDDDYYNNMEIINNLENEFKDESKDESEVEEGYKNMNTIDKKIKENNGIEPDKNNIGKIISSVIMFIGLLIIIVYLGTMLVFYRWAVEINNCGSDESKSLFDYIFPTNFPGITDRDTNTNRETAPSSTGGTNIKNRLKEISSTYFKEANECIKKNPVLEGVCRAQEMKKFTMNMNDPGLKEWFYKSLKDTESSVNSSLKYVIHTFLPLHQCWITFILAFIIYLILFILISSSILPLVIGVKLLYDIMINTSIIGDSNLNIIIKSIFLVLGIISAFFIFMPYGMIGSVMILLKLIFYPLMLKSTDVFIKILKENQVAIKILVMLMSLSIVSDMSQVVDNQVYTGILVAYVPILLYNIYKLFN